MPNLNCGPMPYLAMFLGLTFAVGCSDDEGVNSDEEARRAYLGLDASIERSIALGFQGFNLSSNATIDPQVAMAAVGGTLTVTGKVDQGSSSNKGMRLNIGMVAYDEGDVVINDDGDTIHIVYDTSTDLTMQPYMDLKLNNFPTGSLSGTLDSNAGMTGVYHLTGDIQSDLTLNLTIEGLLMAGPTAGSVLRVPGSTMVTGTATTSDGGVYTIMLTI